jgi:hypothetical protein
MQEPITRDPEVMHGTPVFRGTRVPVKTLFEYLENGESLDDRAPLGLLPIRANNTRTLRCLKRPKSYCCILNHRNNKPFTFSNID